MDEKGGVSPCGGVWTRHVALRMCLLVCASVRMCVRMCTHVIREIKHLLQDNSNLPIMRIVYTR